MKNPFESNITKYYWFKILSDPFFIGPIITIFLLARGLSLAEVFLLQAIFGFGVMLLEIPTGAISDMLGRKKTMVIGAMALAAGIIIYAFSHTFMNFLIGELMFSVGVALISGADSAFLYDTLKRLKREKEYTKIEGKAHSYVFAAAVPGTGVAGFLATADIALPFYATIITILASVFLAISLKEPMKRHMKKYNVKTHISQMKHGLKLALKTRSILWILLFIGIMGGFGRVGFWFYQPYMQQAGVDIAMFGIVFALLNVVAAISSRFAGPIESRIGEGASFFLMALVMIASFMLMGSYVVYLGFMFFFLQQFVRGFSSPILNGYINMHVKTRERATTLSIGSMFVRIIGSTMLIVMGYATNIFSLQTSILLTGVLLFIFFVPMLIMRRK